MFIFSNGSDSPFIFLNTVGIVAGYYFYIYVYGIKHLVVFSSYQIYMVTYIMLFSSLIGFIFKRNKDEKFEANEFEVKGLQSIVEKLQKYHLS